MIKIKTCMYLRLSKDDGENVESNSIINQREIIKNYVKKTNLEIVEEYVDDGYSGANFERPEFKNMIEDATNKKFDCIIVKDLSRFGRDYIGAGNFIQKVFPELGIRFIAITDNYDSMIANVNDTHLILPIRNFINESYCRDISNKVKSSQQIKRQNGEYIGAFAPFGYKKSDTEKNKLIIDLTAADIVKKIFELKVKGYSSNAIAGNLNKLSIPSPKTYKEDVGLAFNGGFVSSKGGKWSSKSVNRIITNKVYIGFLEQGKRIRVNYKSDKELKIDPKSWIVVENAHESIISEEMFYIANKMIERDLKNNDNKEPEILAGMLFCKDCESPLIRRTNKYKAVENTYYICANYNKNGKCSRHSIHENAIFGIVSDVLSKYILYNEVLYEQVKKTNFDKIAFNTEFDNLKKEKDKLELMLKSLYADYEDTIISKEEFQMFRMNYRSKIASIDFSIKNRANLEEELKQTLEEKKKWIIDIERFKKCDKLDRLSIVMLIDKILVADDISVEVLFNHSHKLEAISGMIKSQNIDNTPEFMKEAI